MYDPLSQPPEWLGLDVCVTMSMSVLLTLDTRLTQSMAQETFPKQSRIQLSR